MYISKVAISSSDSYDQHQAIWSLFPDTPERKRDHLFRVENKNRNQFMVLLQSSTEPKSSDKAEVIQSKTFDVVIEKAACYKFKLLANPTKCLSQGKKVVDLKEPDEQVEWLQRKLSGANVTVASMDATLINHRKAFASRFVTYEGVLQVIEPEQIRTAVIMGVGRKKHAGAGLLSLAKV